MAVRLKATARNCAINNFDYPRIVPNVETVSIRVSITTLIDRKVSILDMY